MKTGIASLALGWIVLAGSAAGQSIPRPEHPNPQLQREHWLNLNGPWQFWEGDECDEAGALSRADFPDRITVPFVRESSLSGLGRKGFVKNVVYRREFVVPREWNAGASGDGRVRLHVGACDWRTVVWVNGQRVGFHEGGSAPITCDVTAALKPEAGAANELRVWAFDDTRSKLQQCGKQSDKDESYGCVYTRTTGIWQTVWLERVGRAYVAGFTMDAVPSRTITTSVPLDAGDDQPPEVVDVEIRYATVLLRPQLEGDVYGLEIGVEIRDPDSSEVLDSIVASADGSPLELQIDDPRLWCPEDPCLYPVTITLGRSETSKTVRPGGAGSDVSHVEIDAVDRVETYLGLRTIETRGDAVLLNGKPVFQRLILDQGFNPDGIWTAPSDEALKRDIELSMAAGFNGARLHQKVFEPRFHYWADKLGYLTWGESASWGSSDGNPLTHRVVIQEWTEILARDRNHPSIVGWCPFNETGPASGPLQNAVTTITRAIDPTRLLLDTSGYTHSDPARDVDDAHDYDQDPVTYRARWWPNHPASGGLQIPARYLPPPRKSPFFVSEFGGIGWIPQGEPGWGYGSVPKSEEEWFTRFKGLCDAQLDNPTLFGFCYTQLTDVEQEKNGLYFYDRRPKFDVARLKAIVARRAAIEEGTTLPVAAGAPIEWRVLLPSALDAPASAWRFVATSAPLEGEGWKSGDLGKDAREGVAGFGRKDEGTGVRIGTPWTTSDLYLAREVEWDGRPFARAALVMHYDNAVTLCLNGEPLFRREGWNDRLEPFDVTDRLRTLLRKGRNVLAVHVHQDSGGQYFDAALLLAPQAADGGGDGSSPK